MLTSRAGNAGSNIGVPTVGAGRTPQDSIGRPIAVGDRVSWRGQTYTIKAFGTPVGRFGTRTIEFVETPHLTDETPDEIGVDLVEKR